MKATILMKIAVVFMAAFGAYAFSNSTTNNLDSFYILEGDVCTSIIAECSNNGNFDCKISMLNSPIIYDLGCVREVKHQYDEVVKWEPTLQ